MLGVFLIIAGCGPGGEPALVVATTWPPPARAEVEAIARDTLGQSPVIQWVDLRPGESWASVVDRRGGVDLLLGGSGAEYRRLADSGILVPADPTDPLLWRTVRSVESVTPSSNDPNVDPSSLALAKSTIQAEGWPKGFEELVRRAASNRNETTFPDQKTSLIECAALVKSGRNSDRAGKLLKALEARGVARLPSEDSAFEGVADDLLADLLGSALVDASEELRDAARALVRYDHPAKAEASIGERPPWPPASVTKLQSLSNGDLLVETLLDQVAPEPSARAWLKESWSLPRRPIEGKLLDELARADDGRLAREPRFRSWLRSEWTAWTRQLYRRVARVAGGYVPS